MGNCTYSPKLTMLLETFRKHLYLSDTCHIEVALGTIAANRGSGDPVWLLLVGSPSSGKTEPLNAVSGLDEVCTVSTLTQGSLLSGSSRNEKTKESTGGLLRQIGKRGVIVIKDFGSIISMTGEARGQTLAALREVYDGRWDRTVGTNMGQSLSWEGHIGLLGAVTSQIDTAHTVSGALGERYAMLRMPVEDVRKKATLAVSTAGQEVRFRPELNAAVKDFFLDVEEPPAFPLTDDEVRSIVLAAEFTTRGRSPVERDATIKYEISNKLDTEHPTRFGKMMTSLYRALVYIGVSRERAMTLIRRISCDSMPPIRLALIKALYKFPSGMNAKALSEASKFPYTSVQRALEELEVHEVCESVVDGGRKVEWMATKWIMEHAEVFLGHDPTSTP